MEETQVVIIGCGPAGLAAAIQLKRHGITPLVFEKKWVGGLLANAHLVENYPGFPEGISGPELVGLMQVHLERHSIGVVAEEVTGLDPTDGAVIVTTPARTVEARVVLVASGTRSKDVASVEILEGLADRIHHEVYPLREIRGKRVLIVGSGDAAFDYALSLAANNSITIVNRSRRVRCLPVLWERVGASSGIEYHDETEPVRVTRRRDGSLEVVCKTPGGDKMLAADHVIFAIGREPELGFMSKDTLDRLEDLDRAGVLHLIGDVRTGKMRQTAIAVGDGVMTAMKVHRKLMEVTR